MKSDTERRKYYKEKLHKKKKRLHAHLSKDLRSKLNNKKRSLQVRKGDTVKVMRGPHKGKEAKVSKVNTVARKIFLEGTTVTNARRKEMFVPLEPSNLLLVGLESTEERKKLFSEDVFKKPKKVEKKPAAKSEAAKPEAAKPEEKKPEVKKEQPAAKPEEKKPEVKETKEEKSVEKKPEVKPEAEKPAEVKEQPKEEEPEEKKEQPAAKPEEVAEKKPEVKEEAVPKETTQEKR